MEEQLIALGWYLVIVLTVVTAIGLAGIVAAAIMFMKHWRKMDKEHDENVKRIRGRTR